MAFTLYSGCTAILADDTDNAQHSHRPALTCIVTHKDGDMEPGAGFYEMARNLGYRFREPYLFWADQVRQVFKLHGS